MGIWGGSLYLTCLPGLEPESQSLRCGYPSALLTAKLQALTHYIALAKA